jgi:hypothetical protein
VNFLTLLIFNQLYPGVHHDYDWDQMAEHAHWEFTDWGDGHDEDVWSWKTDTFLSSTLVCSDSTLTGE